MKNKLETQSGGAVEIITNKVNVRIQIQRRQIEIERQRCFAAQQIRIRQRLDIIVIVVIVIDDVVVAVDHRRRRVAVAVAIFKNDGRNPRMVPFPRIHNGFHGPRHLLRSRPGPAKRLLPSHYCFFRN